MKMREHNGVIPKNVQKIIQEKGMKQCVIAEKANYTKQQFNDMLNGRRVIKAVDILKIAEVLNVSPNELFGIGAAAEQEGKGTGQDAS